MREREVRWKQRLDNFEKAFTFFEGAVQKVGIVFYEKKSNSALVYYCHTGCYWRGFSLKKLSCTLSPVYGEISR